MCFTRSTKMGRHAQWRKVVKRERRRQIRINLAKMRAGLIDDDLSSEDYQRWSKNEEELLKFEIEHIEAINKQENEKWIHAEKIAMEQWNKLLQKREFLKQKHLEEQARIQLEFELEQKRQEEEKRRLKEVEEQNKKNQEMFIKRLEQFLSGGGDEIPTEWLIFRETKSGSDPCPFFFKTACCRFGDQCSRNHQYPTMSKVLLATNFYQHFGLENANFNEYDTDLMLEYEDSDTYKEFKEFFNDVLPEFEKFGKIVQFKVCNNYERHLRGNTYIEFAELRSAVAAYRALHTRWYGGKQLSLQFCRISSWKNAICGLQLRKRCPKGRSCNFLHVFRNPNNLFNYYDYRPRRDVERTPRTPPRSWRWSESPEVEISERNRSELTNLRDERDHISSRSSRSRKHSHSKRSSRDEKESRSKKNSKHHSSSRRESSNSRRSTDSHIHYCPSEMETDQRDSDVTDDSKSSRRSQRTSSIEYRKTSKGSTEH